jgi:hypothetical protein
MVGIGIFSLEWGGLTDTVASAGQSFQQTGTGIMAELTKYQQSIVKNYYDNLDTALLQRLGEQVTDLYLAEGKKRVKLWETIEKSLAKLGVPKSRITTIVKSDDARQLAKILQELLAKD